MLVINYCSEKANHVSDGTADKRAYLLTYHAFGIFPFGMLAVLPGSNLYLAGKL